MTNTDREDPEKARALVAHALCQHVAALPPEEEDKRRPVAMALVVPTLLARALGEGGADGVYRETSARLLELASADQNAFRGVVAGMSAGQRAFLEEVIRSGGGGGGRQGEGDGKMGGGVGGGASQPSIALKMDFGG